MNLRIILLIVTSLLVSCSSSFLSKKENSSRKISSYDRQGIETANKIKEKWRSGQSIDGVAWRRNVDSVTCVMDGRRGFIDDRLCTFNFFYKMHRQFFRKKCWKFLEEYDSVTPIKEVDNMYCDEIGTEINRIFEDRENRYIWW